MAFEVSYSRSLFLDRSIPLEYLLEDGIIGRDYNIALRYRVNKSTGLIDCYEYDDAVIFWNRAGQLS